jgi:ATP-dependent DNA helicase RecQ
MYVIEQELLVSLKEYFGFNTFKGNQKQIIESVLNGTDTFVIMPTGGGKSLCYQLPGILSKGTALIISPLIALMKNQVDQVRGYSSIDNIAHFLNSSLNKGQARKVKEDIMDGYTKLLYVAPETLVKDENIEFFRKINVSFIAVDEAHCISEWGHDFRPEYRRIRYMIDSIDAKIPIIALTATATPKVRSDIIKNLQMKDPNVYISSFLRENLYYEIKPKTKKDLVVKDIVKFIKHNKGKSGIIYCLNRKTTEELAKVLNVNGVLAAPYHAGLDANTRSTTQDQFLMEDIEVIVATIAFGMGIDKPDVRFVIHFNIPKSLENYYQETGRAGRDGLEGKCIAYYSYADINKLEKFLRDKPVAEREIGSQHLMEVTAYSESTACRRKFLLHYFGEGYDTSNCGNGECDNCKYPKEKVESKDEMLTALEAIKDLNEGQSLPYLVKFICGKHTQEITNFKHDQLKTFGKGKHKDEVFWNSVLRNGMLENLIKKDIENYGLLKITETGREFLMKPHSVKISMNNNFTELQSEAEDDSMGKSGALDPVLVNILKDVRKVVAKEKKLPPFVIFQDPSIEDMATQYPINMDELSNITGVSRGKAMKYGKKFIEVIGNYVEENNIDRPNDFTMKSVANKSAAKVFFITQIDKRIPLEEIAKQRNISFEELLTELETIVASGTKINIDYHINDEIDEEDQDIIYDYFRTAETDSLEEAGKELAEDGIGIEEIQLIRIKFMSEMAN